MLARENALKVIRKVCVEVMSARKNALKVIQKVRVVSARKALKVIQKGKRSEGDPKTAC